MRGQVFTEFHPSSSCAMLPRDKGGVVDANLRVYGLSNVRVADASVPPIAFSAHLMSSTYGLAEQASTIIRNFHNIGPSTESNVNGTDEGASDPSGGRGSSTDSGSDSQSNDTYKVGISTARFYLWCMAMILGVYNMT